MSKKVKSVKIVDPVVSEYRNQFVIELSFTYGDGDHDGFEVFECVDQEDLERALNILSEYLDLRSRQQDELLTKMSEETNEWLNKNNWSDENPEINTKYGILEIWPNYEGIYYRLDGMSPIWYDENGIEHNVEVEWE